MIRLETPTSRRLVLKAGLAGGAMIIGASAVRAMAPGDLGVAKGAPLAQPAAFLRIGADSIVTVIVKHVEIGQGVLTGLATLVADELDADWAQVRAEAAPTDLALYANRLLGIQVTGGSTSMANSWEQMRLAGAAARAMLVQAAAAAWGVPAGEIQVSKGILRHGDQKAPFGTFAAAAAALPVPDPVVLKAPADWALIGKMPVRRLDAVAKTGGTATYGIDIKRPGLLTAIVARAPRFGGTVKSFDAAAARAVPGVSDVVQISSGIAVLAKNSWSAMQGRDALKIIWDDSKAEMRSSDALLADHRALAGLPGAVAVRRGDAAGVLAGVPAGSGRVISAEYVFPYLAHAPMEPLNAVIELTADGCDVWLASQNQTGNQALVAQVLGLKPAQVRLHTILGGGSFGRRTTGGSEHIVEVAEIAKAINGRAPVRMLHTRTDDIQGGGYRPMFVHRVRGAVDGKGGILAWEHRLVGQSLAIGTSAEKFLVKDGIDRSSVEGISDMPYATANLQVESHNLVTGVPILYWRSVSHSHNAFAKEAFVDALAAASGIDAVKFRLDLLAAHPRQQAVLRLAAAKAGWGTPMAKGRGRGVAVQESFGSFVAHVAEVTVTPEGGLKVDRIVCAIDCGIAVNPDIVRQQMEGGTGWGFGHALRDAITLTGGVVDQSNFDTYEPLRFSDMPAIEVHIMPSAAAPSGVGETAVPTSAPAVANAVFAASGRRLQTLPFGMTAAA